MVELVILTLTKLHRMRLKMATFCDPRYPEGFNNEEEEVKKIEKNKK